MNNEPTLAESKPESLIGIVPNNAHQGPDSLFRFESYDLAIVEFYDQGICYHREQMKGVADRIKQFEDANLDAIIVVFVHGWKHDARSEDDDLQHFMKILEQAARYEQLQAQNQSSAKAPRRVFGIFVGWRGLSLYDGRFHILETITFWTRQAAGRRVAMGSVRELFGYARSYRKNRLDKNGEPTLAIAGHSFGGMIVFSALAQSLIEGASTSCAEVVPSFADLVLLINPAIESVRYLPIKALIDERTRSKPQPPVFVCATAKNDWATGYAFPIGNLPSIIWQSWKGSGEKEARWFTIGHNPSMKTHDLNGEPPSKANDYKLDPPVAPNKKSNSPFWVVQATPDVIDGHGGIYKPVFLQFTADLLFVHADHSAKRVGNPAFHEQAHAL
jgi:hypothetical protein